MKAQLTELRELSQIDVPDGASKLETALLVGQFAHSAFTHNGDNQPSSSDPITVLKEAQAGASFRC